MPIFGVTVPFGMLSIGPDFSICQLLLANRITFSDHYA